MPREIEYFNGENVITLISDAALELSCRLPVNKLTNWYFFNIVTPLHDHAWNKRWKGIK